MRDCENLTVVIEGMEEADRIWIVMTDRAKSEGRMITGVDSTEARRRSGMSMDAGTPVLEGRGRPHGVGAHHGVANIVNL